MQLRLPARSGLAGGGHVGQQQPLQQHHHLASSTAQQPRVQRSSCLRTRCLYSQQPEQQHHRRELEPRSALSLQAQGAHTASAAAELSGRRSTSSPLVVQAAAPKRLRVAVDVDEVLGRFVYALNRFCQEAYGMEYDVSDYWVYEFAKIWGCSQDQSNHIVHEFFESDHFNDGIPIIPGAHGTLTQLASSCELMVVTSRQHAIQDLTLEWLDRHYAGLFSEVYFGNHFALQGASRKKSDICKSIGAHVLIDDNVGYALDCADAGIHVLLYDWEGSYPWSKLPDGFSHPRIQVVRNWGEVEAALLTVAAVEAV